MRVDVLYPNHDFAVHLANRFGRKERIDLYNRLYDITTGLGDWIFRRAAFPVAPENAKAYFRRYYPGSARARFVDRILEVREEFDTFLDVVIARFALDEAAVVGFSSMFQQAVAGFALARKLKEKRPEITIVMGGPVARPRWGKCSPRTFPCSITCSRDRRS